MIRKYLFLIISILFFIHLYHLSCSSDMEHNKKLLDNLQGDWLNKIYIEKLEKTKSPKSAVGGYVTAFKIKKDTFYQWIHIHGFHETTVAEIFKVISTDKNNTYLVKSDREDSHIKDYFVIKDNKLINEIDWIIEENGIQEIRTFIRASPTIDEYVNRTLLAGNYSDMKNRHFSFDSSGRAHWPEKTFIYKVNLDYMEIKCDIFTIKDNLDLNGYGFSWRDDKLYIFNIQGKDVLRCEDKPLYILKRHIRR